MTSARQAALLAGLLGDFFLEINRAGVFSDDNRCSGTDALLLLRRFSNRIHAVMLEVAEQPYVPITDD